MKKAAEKSAELHLRVRCEVARQIRQHGRSSLKAEVCGVLIGSEENGITTIEACIAGANAVQAGTHVTFTQDTWEHIYQVKDRDYPDHRIVGWYHTHPGFGVFLSDHDTFIHQNFFSSPQQVAWVYDPHSEEEGCFAWIGKRLERLSKFSLIDDKGGEAAGETGKPEPTLHNQEDQPDPSPSKPANSAQGKSTLNTAIKVMSWISIFLLGALASWYLFPRPLFVMVDPRTGQAIILSSQEVKSLLAAQPTTPVSPPVRDKPPNPPAPERK